MAGNSFENVERTPSATEDGLQKNRPHPQLRRYSAHYEAVDIATAMTRLQMRRSGEMPRIKGGVDDGSPDMEVSDSLFDENGKVAVDPKAGAAEKAPAVPPEPVASPAAAPALTAPVPRPPTREELLGSAPGSVEASVDVSSDPFLAAEEARFDPFSGRSGERNGPGDGQAEGRDRPEHWEREDEIRRENESLKARVSALSAQLSESRSSSDRLKSSLDGIGRSYDELSRTARSLASEVKAAESPMAYLMGRTRVSVSANGMSFGLSAVAVEESDYGVMLVIPESKDSMTFTPAPLTEVELGWGGLSETLSFCTSFSVPALGVLALVFLRTRSRLSRHAGRAEGPARDPAAPVADTVQAPFGADVPYDPYGGQSTSDLVRKLVAS